MWKAFSLRLVGLESLRTAFRSLTSHWPGTRPRRATFFLVVRQERRQRNVPRCRAPFGGSLLPAMPGGVFANSPCGLKHAKPFFRPSSPPVGTPEGRGNAGYQRSVPTVLSVEARCIRKARSDRGWRVAFFAFFLGEARKKVARRGEIPADVTPRNGTPASKGSSLTCRGENAFHT